MQHISQTGIQTTNERRYLVGLVDHIHCLINRRRERRLPQLRLVGHRIPLLHNRRRLRRRGLRLDADLPSRCKDSALRSRGPSTDPLAGRWILGSWPHILHSHHKYPGILARPSQRSLSSWLHPPLHGHGAHLTIPLLPKWTPRANTSTRLYG